MAAETYADPVFTLYSPAFAPEGYIPTAYTADGTGISPPLSWSTVPAGTLSFVLIAYDPNAPHGDFTHWVLYDLPGDLRSLPEGSGSGANGGLMGVNGKGVQGWTPPNPPANDPDHRYQFDLFAIDRPSIGLPEGATRDQVEEAASYYRLSTAAMIGLYGRRPRRVL